MKVLRPLAFLLLFSSIQIHAHGQAAILAILFGDKVASENFNLSMEIGGTYGIYTNFENVDRGKLGVNFGIAGNARLSKNFFVSPSIYFLAKRNIAISSFSLNSGNVELDNQFTDVSGNLQLNYIDLPILFSFQTNSKKYRFSLGPQFSFLQNAEAIYNGPGGDFHEDFKSNLNTFDYGAMADVAYILGKAHEGRGVFIHARYYYGMADVLKGDNGNNLVSFFSLHLSLPFITDELAQKNLDEL